MMNNVEHSRSTTTRGRTIPEGWAILTPTSSGEETRDPVVRMHPPTIVAVKPTRRRGVAPRGARPVQHYRVLRARSAALSRPGSALPVRRSATDPDTLEHLLAGCLDVLARLAVVNGSTERATQLSGLAHVLRVEAGTALARSGGAAAGMTQLQPVLRGQTPLATRQSEPLPAAAPLSGREREVASLVAQGLTNRQIGEQLVISERTADTHVQNILNKLGITSRAQIAAWVVERSWHAARAAE
jgi:DNA-binding CsgD family transcriptional regulator